MATAIGYLDSIKANYTTKDAKGVLAFKTDKGEVFKSKLDTSYWGIILFNGKTKPVKADITDLQDDHNAYMK